MSSKQEAKDIYSDTTEYVQASSPVQPIIPEAELSEKESAQLNVQLDSLRFKNEQYLRSHPELSSMLKGFLKECFRHQPPKEEILSFAANYFAVRKQQYNHPASARSHTNSSTSR